MSGLGRLWRDHRFALLAFVAAAVITLFFAIRFAASAIYWADPAHRDQHPEGWMTPAYVARSWQVPRDDLARALGLTPTPGRPPTLAQIAAGRGQPLAELIEELEMVLMLLKAGARGQ